MKLQHAVLFATFLLPMGCNGPALSARNASDVGKATNENDLEKLQGVWKVKSIGVRDKKLPDETIKDTRIIVHKDLFHIVEDFKTNRGRSFELKIDAAQTPKQINLTKVPKAPNEFVSPSIYKLDGDTLIVAYVVETDFDVKGKAVRPSEFKTLKMEAGKVDHDILLMELVRTKEAIPQTYLDADKKPRTRDVISSLRR